MSFKGCNGGTCGGLTGWAALIASYAGKGGDHERPHEHLSLMLTRLADWFKERIRGQYGGILCPDIMGDDCGLPDKKNCGGVLAETFALVMEILLREGIDPALPKEEQSA